MVWASPSTCAVFDHVGHTAEGHIRVSFGKIDCVDAAVKRTWYDPVHRELRGDLMLCADIISHAFMREYPSMKV